MNQLDDQDIRDALHEIASWPASPAQEPLPVQPDRESNWTPQRLVLVAATFAVFAGLSAAYLFGGSSTQLETAANPGNDTGQAGAVEACLAIDADFNLEPLRSEGVIHQLGDNADGLVIVITDGQLQLSCALAQRDDGEWFVAASSAGAYLPLVSTTAVSVSNVIELNDQMLIVGQAGSSIDGVEIDLDRTITPAALDGGWWAASILQPARAVDAGFPNFEVRWEYDGEQGAAAGEDLVPESAFSLCAQDDDCRTRRIAELKQLAANASTPLQATILEDDMITNAEYRSVLTAWGDCIAVTADVSVTYDDNGTFTIQQTTQATDEAFLQCQTEHTALATEAAALLAFD